MCRLCCLSKESKPESTSSRRLGDRVQDVPISTLGTKAVFTKEIEDALLAQEIDLAVHSLKDMMTTLPDGLVLAATPEREDPHDVLAGCAFRDLKAGARVGTGSSRRATQLKALRPDLEILEIRGNVDTRLRKLDEGQYDAVVLAAAGLRRLGLASRIMHEFNADQMTPAPGQGALAIETCAGSAGYDAARLLHDQEVFTAITAERAVLGGARRRLPGPHWCVCGGLCLHRSHARDDRPRRHDFPPGRGRPRFQGPRIRARNR